MQSKPGSSPSSRRAYSFRHAAANCTKTLNPSILGFAPKSADTERLNKMEETPLARNTDPFTSHIAPSSKTTRDTIRLNVLKLFKKYGFMTDEQLVIRYQNTAEYAPATDQGIRTRRSELVREGLISARLQGFGITSTGRRCIIWELQK